MMTMTPRSTHTASTSYPSHTSMRTALLALALCVAPFADGVAQVPEHPDQIDFPTLEFIPPEGAEWRHELPSGVPVYIVPSDEFPLVSISFSFMGGEYLAPADQTGVAGILGSQMRRGGTTSVAAEELDERLDFLAANVSTFVGGETAGASLDCLKSNFDEAFGLFMDVVRNPGFDEERLRVNRDQMIEGFKQRNDNPMPVAMSSMSRMIYGDDHYQGREATVSSIESATPGALRALHGQIFHPGNLIVGVTGDVDPGEVMAQLERAFAGWEVGPRNPAPPAPTKQLDAGVYHARTSQSDLPQGTTILVGKGMKRDDPDALAVQVMNDVLGGGGFTSRITNRVRSDEGLAYTAVSFYQNQVWYEGLFGAFYQSKNRTVALAAKIVLEEIDRIRTEPVSDDELAVAKNALVEAFPQRFASKSAMLGVFMGDEMTGRDPDHWRTWRERVESVDASTVLRVAQEHLDPDGLAMLVVGKWDEIAPGDLEGRASMNEFHGGEVTHLPMLDPLTREPMPEDEDTAN
jgi:predicted Zn-dependent peptidase